MKQCVEDVELKLQGNKQSVVYSGIKNIVKSSSGKQPDTRVIGTHLKIHTYFNRCTTQAT